MWELLGECQLDVSPSRILELMDRYQIIPRAMFDDDHLVLAYDINTPPNAHKLACVFLVMALGVMFDLNRQPCRSPLLYQADE